MMSVHGAAFSAADHAHMAEALRLAARGAEIELCEIDTGSDYESAKGFVRSRHL